jgi:hypothetical protein
VPDTEAEFTVRGAVPEEVSESDCIAEELTVTLPKFSDDALVDN